MYYVLVDTQQQMPYYHVLKQTHPLRKQIQYISKKQSNVPSIHITDIIPDIVPYHDIYVSGRHLYTKPGVQLADYTDKEETPVPKLQGSISNLITHHRMKFILYDKDTYKTHGTLLLSQLIANKCLVLLVSGDHLSPEISQFYSDITVSISEDGIEEVSQQWNDTKAHVITELTTEFEQTFIKKSQGLPHYNDVELNTCNDIAVVAAPEDYYAASIPAETNRDKKGNQALHLSQTAGADSLPNITVIITHKDHVNSVLREMMVKYNKNTTRYPTHRITYIEQEAGSSLRTYVEQTQTDIVVLMAPDVLYLPHSMYAKVKLILDNPECQAVASNILGHYHIEENKSYTVYAKYPDADGLAFTREFFLRYPDIQDADDYFYHNRFSSVWDLPFNFNCLIIHTDKLPEKYQRGVNNKIHNNLFDAGVTQFMTKLYRKLN